MNNSTEKNDTTPGEDDNVDIMDHDIDDLSDLDNEYDVEDGYDDFVPEKKLKKGLITALIIAVVILGGGFMFFQNMAQKPATNTAIKTTQNNTEIKPDLKNTGNTAGLQKMPAPTPPPLPTPIGPDVSTSILPPNVIEAVQPEMPVNSITEVGRINKPNQPPADNADKSDDDINAIIEEVLPPIMPIKNKNNLSLPQQTQVMPDINDETTLNKITKRLDSLSEKILAIEERREAEKTTNNTVPDLENEKVEILTQQMLQINHRLDQMTKKVDSALADNVHKKTTAKQKSPKKSVTKVKAQKSKTAPKWTLKSAQPGIAWLSKENSGEINRYSVGESLSGIGVIKSITQQDGQWVVQGANGKIEQ